LLAEIRDLLKKDWHKKIFFQKKSD
jgi:hypothetical protein